jgi:hypothetical protein
MTEYEYELLGTIAALRAQIDRLDCTIREGGDTRHCGFEDLCLRCKYDKVVAANDHH